MERASVNARVFMCMTKGGLYISTCRDEQCRQGWNNQDSKEIQRDGRDTEEGEKIERRSH